MDVYDNGVFDRIRFDYTYLLDLEYNIEYGKVKSKNSITVYMWSVDKKLRFYPNQITFQNSIYIDLGKIQIGIRHTCYHPMIVTQQGLRMVGKFVRPKWEGAYDELYLTIGNRL